jgi:hypothetical protein
MTETVTTTTKTTTTTKIWWLLITVIHLEGVLMGLVEGVFHHLVGEVAVVVVVVVVVVVLVFQVIPVLVEKVSVPEKDVNVAKEVKEVNVANDLIKVKEEEIEVVTITIEDLREVVSEKIVWELEILDQVKDEDQIEEKEGCHRLHHHIHSSHRIPQIIETQHPLQTDLQLSTNLAIARIHIPLLIL